MSISITKNVAILGSGGAVSNNLRPLLELDPRVKSLRLVSRSQKLKSEAKIEYISANLLDSKQVEEALKDIDLIYLTAGLKYSYKVWSEQWPVIIKNILMTTQETNAKLVFFDNVYALGSNNLSNLTEETPVNPSSKKGEVRASIQEILETHMTQNTPVVIARSADFYGPFAKLSLFYVSNIQNLLLAKKPYWLGRDDRLHSFTYIPDACNALVELGFNPNADNQIWHLPTSSPLTGKQYMEIINKEFDRENRYSTLPKFLVRFAGLFNSDLREMLEMFYQYQQDYVFNSKKFESNFKTKPTSYNEGIKATIKHFRMMK